MSSPPETSRQSDGRDTGFPEPFCQHRNTTLPHPEADTSPNPHFPRINAFHHSHPTHQRSHSILHRHHRATSHGSLPRDTSSSLVAQVTTAPSLHAHAEGEEQINSSSSPSASEPHLARLASTSSLSKEGPETPPTPPEAAAEPHRSGFFRRLPGKNN